ncbi:uncharacterized protein LOC124116631 [Haliotis rufescens]|uniref:uncharacterized protein LOC124116631 n=1 Tax=Haliotis rufescens TaxID=6454 RepID=UPI001EAFBBD1|nr:uncharacterized protein LOC124116631 [Haliotis rufescens]
MDPTSKESEESTNDEKKSAVAGSDVHHEAGIGEENVEDADIDNEDRDDIYMVPGSSSGNGGSETMHSSMLRIPTPEESNFLMENKNTNRKTGADMKILVSYLKSLNEKRPPECIPPIELDKYLSSFFMVVRKFDGAEYEPCSLRAMLASIERYLKLKCYPTSLTRDIHFAKTRAALKLKQQMLKQMGKGVKSQISSTSHVMEQRLSQLCKSQEFGPYTPVSVLFSLCFVFVVNLKMRKATEHKKLLWGDIMLGVEEESGREYLAFSPQMLHRTANSHLRQARQMIWSKPEIPEQDPVALYKLYAEKRPIAANHRYSPFYLGVNVNQPAPAQSWYRPCALGMNKLNEMVRQIRDLTGMAAQVAPSEGTAVVTGDGDSNCDSTNASSVDNDEGELNTSQNDSYSRQDSKVSDVLAYHVIAQPDSELDSSDSLSHQSLSFNEEIVDDVADQQDNCHGTVSGYSTDDNIANEPHHSEHTDDIDLATAKHQLSGILQRMDILDLVAFDQWLKKMKIGRDTATGEIVCREDGRGMQSVSQLLSRKRSHDSDVLDLSPDKTKLESLQESTNITLNISLTPQALLGGGPVTVTAHTSRAPPVTDIPDDGPAQNKNQDKIPPTKSSTPSGIAKSVYPIHIIPNATSESSTTKYSRLSPGVTKREGLYSYSSIAARGGSSYLRQLTSGHGTAVSSNSGRPATSTHHSTLSHRSEPSIVKTVLQQTLRPASKADFSHYLSRSMYHHPTSSSLTNGHSAIIPEPGSGPVFPKPEPV